MVFENTEHKYYMDGYLQQNLDIAKKVIQKDWDMLFVVDGYEGSGKSVFAQQMGYFCDPTLTVDRIVFNPTDFKDAVNKADKYQAIIYDEAYGGLSSKTVMGKINHSIVQMLTVIRKKNLFIFIVLPTIFDLGKYVALWRSRALIHVYTGDNFERGYFEFYNIDRKKELYVQGKKLYDYKNVRPNFRGRFTNKYMVDKNAYEKKKDTTSIDLDVEEKVSKNESLYRVIHYMYFDAKLTQPKIAEYTGFSQRWISKIVNRTNTLKEQRTKKYTDLKDMMEVLHG